MTEAARHYVDAMANAQMERMVADLGRLYHERNQALEEVTRAHHEALLQLSIAAEFKDDDTGVHIVRIGFLAECLALHLGQPAAYAQMLRRAAPMHDIGKIGTPDAVLKKPGPLTPEEREIMKQHTTNGAAILGMSNIPVFKLAAETALSHHERWDGKGYPCGLSGRQIPLSGRIVAVVDFFDALTMDRVYRKAFSVQETVRMIQEERGAAFDPEIVDVFLAHLPEIQRLHQRVTDLRPSFRDLVEKDIALW